MPRTAFVTQKPNNTRVLFPFLVIPDLTDTDVDKRLHCSVHHCDKGSFGIDSTFFFISFTGGNPA